MVKSLRQEPLHVQLEKENEFKQKTKVKKEKQQEINQKLSAKILKMVKEQQLEISQENKITNRAETEKTLSTIITPDDSESELEQDQDHEEWHEKDLDHLNINPDDQMLLDKFMNKSQKMSLSETIISKIQQAKVPSTQEDDEEAMNPKVIEVFTKVGMLLSRYKSGPIPKTFKIIPTLRDWEQVLNITNPAEWTPQATYQATRIFTSNLKAKMAQRFFNVFLLEKVREDIQETKKLNYHLYMALKKSLYKPAAFFKGFLLPLCESGDCTLREAAIIGSVLVKVSVPVLHSAAALLKIAEMEYTGANSLFIRILLDKKYALPYKVIDSLVFHFLGFKNDKREMPVLWHQSLLVFAQRYKEDLTPEQKEALVELSRVKSHDEISVEVRRELINSVCRGEMKPEPVDPVDVEMGS